MLGGSGRQSLARIAAWLCQLSTFQIEITKNYRTNEFKEDLKGLYYATGVRDAPTSFLFNDTQVCSALTIWFLSTNSFEIKLYYSLRRVVFLLAMNLDRFGTEQQLR